MVATHGDTVGREQYVWSLTKSLFRSLLYPLKTSEKQRVSDVFRGYRKRSVGGMKWVNKIHVFKVNNDDIRNRKAVWKVTNGMKQVQDSFQYSIW